MESNPSSTRTDRKTIERNRRTQMKALYSKLYSLIPHHTTKEPVSLPDQLDEATNYIKKLQTNLERMKQRKDSLMRLEESRRTSTMELRTPQIQIQELGLALVVTLITGLDGQVMFNEITRLLHEEGAEIVNASFSAVGDDTVFHTIHSTVGNSGSSNETARISERLRKFIEDSTSSF